MGRKVKPFFFNSCYKLFQTFIEDIKTSFIRAIGRPRGIYLEI